MASTGVIVIGVVIALLLAAIVYKYMNTKRPSFCVGLATACLHSKEAALKYIEQFGTAADYNTMETAASCKAGYDAICSASLN